MAKKPTHTPPTAPLPPPWVRYDKATAEEILDVCQRGGKGVWRRVLEYERANQKRAEIIDALTIKVQ